MDRVLQIKEEIKQLETQLDQLKLELTAIQKNCEHTFKSNHYVQECTKCHMIESLNW
ncbi:serine protease [Bacillus sp. RG28]|uniref:Serine protease n=1 Tax=Gottfriedia endophytica TaxID=2820819 RepID=A0A940NJH6_9BACI|nr:serine protease [Gottfriedia endophytica]MBP0725292.1 serine protease [Gottfriedia endophytica]